MYAYNSRRRHHMAHRKQRKSSKRSPLHALHGGYSAAKVSMKMHRPNGEIFATKSQSHELSLFIEKNDRVVKFCEGRPIDGV